MWKWYFFVDHKSIKKILIIDDDMAIIEMLVFLLDTKGYKTVWANDGVDGIDLAKRENPDGIILDVMMPKMSGYMVAALIQKDPDLSNIPILLLTATAQLVGDIELTTPVKYRLSKPFEKDVFLELVHEMVNG